MNFVLLGFVDKAGVRQFSFNCIATDRSKRMVIVLADVTLARKHAIRLQELPLHCVRLLESIEEGAIAAAVTLTEDDMAAIQRAAQVAADKKPHKPPRRHQSQAVGQAWRDTHTL